MTSLLLRNLFFIILQPGLVTVAAPYWIGGAQFQKAFNQPFTSYQNVSLIIFCVGFVILMACIFRFPFEGKGTISPLDETKQLVLGGLYRYSRNPMYTGAMLMLIAESMFIQSKNLAIYSAIVFICFNLFIIFHEEPRLQKDFGDQYSQYRKKVRRWL